MPAFCRVCHEEHSVYAANRNAVVAHVRPGTFAETCPGTGEPPVIREEPSPDLDGYTAPQVALLKSAYLGSQRCETFGEFALLLRLLRDGLVTISYRTTAEGKRWHDDQFGPRFPNAPTVTATATATEFATTVPLSLAAA